jgi:4,5:9,10-diseco-3-hydroxy-5,9,17-trioxoandrosta-1(10),2-diene-4-oate hydrolase
MLAMSEIQETFCEVGGARVHYLLRESVDLSNTLVLLHSFASGAFLWRDLIASTKFPGRIVAPDLPGNGHSSLPAEIPGLDYYVGFLNEFCDVTSIEKFLGFGVSMGSNILVAFASQYPQKVSRMILTNPIDDTVPLNRLWKIIAQPGIGELITKFFPGSKNTLRKQISKNFFHPERLNSDLISHWWNAFENGVIRRWIPKALRAPQITIRWQDVNVPCTVVFGKNDPVVSTKFRKRLQSTMTQAAFIELDQCGHYPHLEYPEKMEELIVESLRL